MPSPKKNCQKIKIQIEEVSVLRKKLEAHLATKKLAEAKKTAGLIMEKIGSFMVTEREYERIISEKFDADYGYFGDEQVRILTLRAQSRPGVKSSILVDRFGRRVNNEIYDSIGRFSEGVCFVKQGNRGFFIDHAGKQAVPGDFDAGVSFYNGIASVMRKNNYFLINRKGVRVSKLYSEIKQAFYGSYAVYRRNDKVFLVLANGKEYKIPQCKEVDKFDGEFIYGKHDQAWYGVNEYSIWNLKGKRLADDDDNHEYESVETFRDGIALVTRKVPSGHTAYFFINKKGKPIMEARFFFARSFSHGRAAVEFEDKWYYIGVDGNVAIEKAFDSAESFSEGCALVQSAGRYYFIDTAGNQLFGKTFEKAWSFQRGFAPVKVDGETLQLDKTGKLSKPEQVTVYSGIYADILKRKFISPKFFEAE